MSGDSGDVKDMGWYDAAQMVRLAGHPWTRSFVSSHFQLVTEDSGQKSKSPVSLSDKSEVIVE